MADQKTEFSSMSTDIAKVQASVTLLVIHISIATPEPSSTSDILSCSFTPSPQAGLLPIPCMDSKFQGQLGLLSSFAGTSMVRNLGFEITYHAKPTATNFDGSGDATLFVDWISFMEDFFEWYDMSDAQRIRFAKLKLVKSAKQNWKATEHHLQQLRQTSMILWDEMKLKLREQYLPSFYRHQLLNQLWTLFERYYGQLAIANQTLPTTDMQTGFSGPSNLPAPPPNKGLAVSTNACVECFHCLAKGHIASRFLQQTLTINTPASELCEIVEHVEDVYDLGIDDC
ncbi:hypothetical protein L3X38_026317 [Prunus dulcis]|uniref:Retrotransposon gag domain-containing protein n=1 Tax=Prunus dulcis TaxID=3755 RepID=A0AAD4UPU2_PRUDU|nr:hypothetical protein L3X38_026317 [Prunus dulcis]